MTQIEHLSVELFRLIFEYLAPHDLLLAFENLNQSFTTILAHQPFCLPDNRHMSVELYSNYLTTILPNHASQIVYLHLSERYTPHAVRLFLSEVPIDTLDWFALKAITIDDVPCDVFQWLLNDCSLLSKIHSLSIHLDQSHYHYSEYDDLTDFDIVIPLLNELLELRTFHLCINATSLTKYVLDLAHNCPRIINHTNLHTLSISPCSRELLVTLLDNGHLPKLHRLRVSLYSEEDLIRPTPLQQACVPELREVHFQMSNSIGWILTYLEDIHRHSQLEHFKISAYLSFTPLSDIPRVAELRRWLALSKSIQFTFQLQLWIHCLPEHYDSREEFLNEYIRATGHSSVAKNGNLSLRYPTMTLSADVKMSDNELDENEDNISISSSDFLDEDDEFIDETGEGMDVIDLNYSSEELQERIRSVPYRHCLRKIKLLSSQLDENDVVGGCIPYLVAIVQHSPNLRELHIDANLDFGRMLSRNVELGILLAAQLEVLEFSGVRANCTLLNLARIIDTLFTHSSASPILKNLVLNVDAHPSWWLSIRHLTRGIRKILDRFPTLIHFTLHCEPAATYRESIYNLSDLAPEWYVKLMLSRSMLRDPLLYRHTSNSLDIWL